jgi:nucleotide-binding universal stress UspA family protein
MKMADNQHSTVVVGIDGSPASLTALRWALAEAVRLRSTAEVVHSYLPQTLTDFTFGSPHELHTRSVCMVAEEVAAALAEMTTHPTVVETSLPGGPATILLQRAEHASLVVLGAHGKPALRDIVLGEVSASVIRHAPCPVVIVGLNRNTARYNHSHAASAT